MSMKLVFEQSEPNFAADRAREAALSALSQLTGHMLEVCRHGRQSHEVFFLAMEYVAAEIEHHKITGQWLSDADLSTTVEVSQDRPDAGLGNVKRTARPKLRKS